MRATIQIVALALTLLASTSPGLAAEDQTPEAAPHWQFDVMPYAWLPAMFTTIQAKGQTANIDLTIGGLLTLVWHGNGFASGGYFAARYDRWSAFVDTFGGFMNVGTSVRIPTRACHCLQVGATVDLRPVILDVAVGYQLGEWSLPKRQRPISLGVYLGTRYTYLGETVNIEGGVLNGTQRAAQVGNSFNVAHPIIGVRWEVPLLDSLSLDFRGDIGGLPANSQLTWALVGGVRYWPGWELFGSQTWLAAEYKVVDFQRDFGRGAALDMQLRGPLLAVGFTF